jgi:hypothetical protein
LAEAKKRFTAASKVGSGFFAEEGGSTSIRWYILGMDMSVIRHRHPVYRPVGSRSKDVRDRQGMCG